MKVDWKAGGCDDCFKNNSLAINFLYFFPRGNSYYYLHFKKKTDFMLYIIHYIY